MMYRDEDHFVRGQKAKLWLILGIFLLLWGIKVCHFIWRLWHPHMRGV